MEIGIHAYLAPSHLEEKVYVGALFVAADVLLAGVLFSLVTGLARPAGWLLGAGVCAGMFVGFVLSRTIGLPGYHEAWSSDHWLGVVWDCQKFCVRHGVTSAASGRGLDKITHDQERHH